MCVRALTPNPSPRRTRHGFYEHYTVIHTGPVVTIWPLQGSASAGRALIQMGNYDYGSWLILYKSPKWDEIRGRVANLHVTSKLNRGAISSVHMSRGQTLARTRNTRVNWGEMSLTLLTPSVLLLSSHFLLYRTDFMFDLIHATDFNLLEFYIMQMITVTCDLRALAILWKLNRLIMCQGKQFFIPL